MAGSPAAEPGKNSNPTLGISKFAPGVRIDWKNRRIEVDAKIVFRQGPLELLACSPKTREHESILSVAARPMHIFQAMGLIGLEPGSPASYDEQKNQWQAPRGEALSLLVRYQLDGKTHTITPRSWMREVKTRKPPKHIPWVFAGSQSVADGRFGADFDGTIVCVVDFETALICPGVLHSADNDALWLEADPDAIPPLKTPCTLLIESAAKKTKGQQAPRKGQVSPSTIPTKKSKGS